MVNLETHNLAAFGESLRNRLKASRLTTYQAAQLLDIRSCDLSDILDGQTPFTEELGLKISRGFGLNLMEFELTRGVERVSNDNVIPFSTSKRS